MKKVSLSGSPRENVGKKDAAQLRKQGNVPCVLYGGKEQVHFHASEVKLNKLFFTPDVYQVELDLNGTKHNTIVQEVQQHPVTDRIIHMDFLQLSDDKPVKVKLPVRTEGNSEGVRQGGKLRQNYRKLTLSGLPSALPEDITVNIEELGIGDSIRVRDIAVEGVNFLDPESAVVVAVKMARGAAAAGADEEEAAAEGAEAPAEGGGEAAAEG